MGIAVTVAAVFLREQATEDPVSRSCRHTPISARVGWTFEMFQDDWGVDLEFLETMRQGLGRGTYRLVSHANRQEFVARWRLYVPADLPYEDWVKG